MQTGDNHRMAHSLDSLTARLQRLEDIEAIRALVAQYGPLADSGRAKELSQLWCEEGEYDIFGYATASGRKAIAKLIEDPDHQSLMTDGCAHLLGPVAIDLDGDRATARGHSVVLRHKGDGFEVFRVSANNWKLERRSEGWCVVRRTNALLDGREVARLLLTPTA